MGPRVHTDIIIMVRTTECMISTIYVVVNINTYYIKLSLTNNDFGVALAVGVGGVVVGGGSGGGSGALVTTVDVSTGAAVVANNNNAVGAVIPLSSTNDEEAYVSALVAFGGVCIGAFADGAGESAAASAQLPLRCRRRAVPCRHASCCRHRR